MWKSRGKSFSKDSTFDHSWMVLTGTDQKSTPTKQRHCETMDLGYVSFQGVEALDQTMSRLSGAERSLQSERCESSTCSAMTRIWTVLKVTKAVEEQLLELRTSSVAGRAFDTVLANVMV